MTGHKIIRNSDGTAYVVDHKGHHVATHDSATEAKEHLEQLREQHKPSSETTGHKLMKLQKEHPDRDKSYVSHDPYYSDQHKNKR